MCDCGFGVPGCQEFRALKALLPPGQREWSWQELPWPCRSHPEGAVVGHSLGKKGCRASWLALLKHSL